MKKIQSKIEYTVPHWRFCNSDNLDIDGKSKAMCKFCKTSRAGAECLLYNRSLSVEGAFIGKTQKCIDATAGYGSTIITDNVTPPGPTVSPKKIAKSAIETYIKTVKDLRNQGYPTALAEQTAKTYVLEDN